MRSTGEDSPRRERFERIYAETRVPILGYLVRRTSIPADAADLLAETYVIAWRKLEDLVADEEARLWLYAVARRVLANHNRHQAVEKNLAAALRSQLTAEVKGMRVPEEVPFDDVIAASLAALDPTDREIMQLSAWEQLAPRDIAQVMGLTAGAIRVRLHRVRARLRADLIQAGHPGSGSVERAG
jgi:RNA polymerase sigma factor (sigma-70 family)